MGDAAKQVGCRLEVPVRALDVRVPEVGREGELVASDAKSIPRACLECAHGERVPQVMKPRLTRTRVAAANSRKGA